MDRILNTDEAASVLGVSPYTLRDLRCKGGGPAFVQLTKRRVGYREQTLAKYIAERERASTSDPGPDPGNPDRETAPASEPEMAGG